MRHGASQTSVKFCPPEEDQQFERSALIPSSILDWNVELGHLECLDCRVI